jgi:RecJ-like exonuclease
MSLEKFALITAILGIILLIFLSETLEPKKMTIGKITSKDIDSYVKVSGDITYIKQYTSSTLLKIEDSTGKIYAIFYGNANISKGYATITGKVTEYRGILEIEAEKIKVLP